MKSVAKHIQKKRGLHLWLKKATVREVPLGLNAIQMFPSQVMHLISAMLKDYVLHEIYGHLSLNM